MKYEEILHRCFRCGFCKFTTDYSAVNCPSYRKFRFDTYAPGGRMWLIRAWLNDEIPNSERFQEILFSCATCGSCVEHCAFTFRDDLVNIIVAAREEMVNRGVIPPVIRDYFKSIYTYGNPYKEPIHERGRWADGTSLEPYRGQEYLFYVGCVGSYDERGQKSARAVGSLLVKAGVPCGILGDREICDGNEVRALGEAGLFQFLAERNIALWKELGVKKIITMDPHAFNAIRNDYPAWGGDFEVSHYTQVLATLIASKALSLMEYKTKITYHDPCYLGRHNAIYNTPRKILKAIPGVELVEMEQSRDNALCCGGGGGNFFSDILGGGDESPSRIRVRQALETGVPVLAVACPQCAKMLEDAVKAEAQDDRLEVLDLAEIVTKALS